MYMPLHVVEEEKGYHMHNSTPGCCHRIFCCYCCVAWKNNSRNRTNFNFVKREGMSQQCNADWSPAYATTAVRRFIGLRLRCHRRPSVSCGGATAEPCSWCVAVTAESLRGLLAQLWIKNNKTWCFKLTSKFAHVPCLRSELHIML